MFLHPLVKVEGDALEDDEQIAGEIPAEVRKSLRFLDEEAIRARDSERTNVLTDLGHRLAPEDSKGLVRRPRSYDLINDALAPRLQIAVDRPEEQTLALSLLRQAARWINTTGESNTSRVQKEALRVPVLSGDNRWEWDSPTNAYFGDGWLDEPRDQMLAKAYGNISGRRLVPWVALCGAFEQIDVLHGKLTFQHLPALNQG